MGRRRQSRREIFVVMKLFSILTVILVTRIYTGDKEAWKDFPGGPVVKNPPYNAGNVGLTPGQGTKIPHAAGQLSPCTTTTELARLN